MARAGTVLLVALLALPSPSVPLAAAPSREACASAGGVPVTVAAVETRLELRLADGRRLRLVGLDPAGRTPGNPDLGETNRAAFAAMVAGKALHARILTDKPDRWGRLAAMAFLDDAPTSGGLAAAAIAAGLARYLPEAAGHACREALLSAEGEARSATLGLWRDPYYGVLAVDDRSGFAERSATGVIAEGRLWRVDAGPFRTKLRFAAPKDVTRDLLVAVVVPKVVKRFEEQGVHFEALIGRTLRVRGLLDLSFGPQVEVAGPDALEMVGTSAAGSDAGSTSDATTP